EGASAEALERIRKLGSTNIIISSVKPVEAEATRQQSHLSIYGLLYDDEVRVRSSFREVRRTAPAKIIRKEGRLGTRTMEVRVVGTTPEWFALVRRDMIAGRCLTEQDVREKSPTVVLTEYGARRLLATQSTIGQKLKIGSDYLEVVGIVRSEGGPGSSVQTPDQEVDAYIPLSLARERFGDVFTMQTSGSRIREKVELHQLIVEVDSTENVQKVAAGIERLLSHFHPKGDFRISVPLALLREAEATKRTFNIVLGSIAGISLLVGGIGIMNIMLAAVTERTREIGVRRAVGAKRRQIIGQFLIETVVLSSVGGAVGIVVGLSIPWVITRIAHMRTIITAHSIVLSVGISMAVGIIFGLYPAVRAANVDPIVALRHE
ncbi:MAG: ABC transporter permease, partial [Ignavibacteria bacterium]|nr:ABC transporter permease [Ignavibacteria bacterium]